MNLHRRVVIPGHPAEGVERSRLGDKPTPRLMLPRSGLFVTGTDTGVGKTHVACSLLGTLAKKARLLPRKPAESGCAPRSVANDPADHWQDSALFPEDAHRLALAAELPADRFRDVNRYRYATACAPDQAARIEGQTLTLEHIVAASRVPRGWKPLVEGAGGYYSPLSTDGALNADLADALGLPLLVVAPDRLGVQGQVLLLVEAAMRRNRPIAAIVLNRGPSPYAQGAPDDGTKSGESMLENRRVLRERTGLTVVTYPFDTPPVQTPTP